HLKLMECLREMAPLYDDFIWEEERAATSAMEEKLGAYRARVKTLFQRIDNFYGTGWDLSIPFKVSLYPIPLRAGVTTAVPKGNALICSFLSKSDKSYEGLLGVIVHEMCHILFDEQSVKTQQQLDAWMLSSTSPYAKLAYNYLDEGLATALGNGWAFTQLHGKYDTTQWYNDPYIEGFARALYPMVTEYMDAGKSLDQSFVERAIELFGETFPEANKTPKTLLTEMHLYADLARPEDLQKVGGTFQKQLGTLSMWMSTPIRDEESMASFSKPGLTKTIVIGREAVENQEYLRKHFPELPAAPITKGWVAVWDDATNSSVFLIVMEEFSDFEQAVAMIRETENLEFGMVTTWD
ncbi:MAG: hypothetical protein AAF597_07860, partial [Bacteroidota bacterium]